MIDSQSLKRNESLLISIGLALFAALTVLVLRPWHFENGFMTIAPVGRDFVNFWLGGKLALAGQLDVLADWDRYNELIWRGFDRNPEAWFIFSYPPNALLFLVPFGAMHHWLAVALWTALDVVFIVLTVRLLTDDRRMIWITCLSPAVLVMIAFGQPIGPFAFLATCALLRGRERPVLAGLCLAVMTVKPQFAVVLGLFMLLTGYWRAILHAILPSAAVIALSVLAFGIQPWVNFFTWTMPIQNRFIFDFIYDALLVTVSVYCGVRMFGLPGWAAGWLQAIFSAVVMIRAVQIFRRRGPDARAITLALFAVVAVLPYYNCYDLALFAPALSVALFRNDAGDEREFLPLIPALLLWIVPMLAIPFGMYGIPVAHPIIAGVLLWALFRDGRVRAAATSPAAVPEAGLRPGAA
jgi:hypothetical protein